MPQTMTKPNALTHLNDVQATSQGPLIAVKKRWKKRPDRDQLARFFSKVRVNPSTGCWEWTASVVSRSRSGGYGAFQGATAYRASYTWFVGEVRQGMHLDHLCRNPSCCNPAHLEEVTAAENRSRQDWLKLGTCKHGHPLTEENVRLHSPSHPVRICYECERNRRHAADRKRNRRGK